MFCKALYKETWTARMNCKRTIRNVCKNFLSFVRLIIVKMASSVHGVLRRAGEDSLYIVSETYGNPHTHTSTSKLD